jgi:hypothetical protein
MGDGPLHGSRRLAAVLLLAGRPELRAYMQVVEGLARRIVEIAVCVAAVAACSALAWWQWQRFAAGGSFQNLGYVLQWPLFGLFPAFVVWRLRRLKPWALSVLFSTPPAEARAARPILDKVLQRMLAVA